MHFPPWLKLVSKVTNFTHHRLDESFHIAYIAHGLNGFQVTRHIKELIDQKNIIFTDY